MNYLINSDNGLHFSSPFFTGECEVDEEMQPDDHTGMSEYELIECHIQLSEKCICKQDEVNLAEIKRLLNIK